VIWEKSEPDNQGKDHLNEIARKEGGIGGTSNKGKNRPLTFATRYQGDIAVSIGRKFFGCLGGQVTGCSIKSRRRTSVALTLAGS